MQVKFIAYPVTVLGPGKRIGIWTTGCNRRCPYCTSPSLWEFDDDLDVPVDNLIKQIENYKKENVVDGITISGGEPFLQKDLIVLLEKLRELQIDDILVYTGYKFKAKSQVQGVVPVSKVYDSQPYLMGFHNSLLRVKLWIDERIKTLDNKYNYNLK